MSHLRQRKEKNCLNCNAVVYNKYCSVCGQENLEPQESVWHLTTHFFNDITHFDGKFFSSIKDVVIRPGFLSSEYMKGRRASYLNPVRFYVFTSFIFFLILFSFFVKKDDISLDGEEKTNNKEKDNNIFPLLKSDSAYYFEDDSTTKNENTSKKTKDTGTATKNNFKIFNTSKYKTKQQYDSLLKLGKVDEEWYKKIMIRKGFEIKEKYGEDKRRTLNALMESAFHAIPQVLFISLPFFALLLKLIYIRRKKFYYVAHAIFTLHFYIFIYLDILLIYFISYLAESYNLGLLYDFTLVLGFAIIFYLYKAMRNFYGQSRWKTIFKLIILSFLLVFLLIFLLIILFGLSIYKM